MSVRKHRATVWNSRREWRENETPDSRIDDADRLLIDTDETRVTIDTRWAALDSALILTLPAPRPPVSREGPRGAGLGGFAATCFVDENIDVTSPSHEHGSCESERRPAWEAKEKLEEDDEWRESFPDENVEKLRSHTRVVEKRKPIPEPLPEGAEPPDNAGETVQ
jgi:hypothetical protein